MTLHLCDSWSVCTPFKVYNNLTYWIPYLSQYIILCTLCRSKLSVKWESKKFTVGTWGRSGGVEPNGENVSLEEMFSTGGNVFHRRKCFPLEEMFSTGENVSLEKMFSNGGNVFHRRKCFPLEEMFSTGENVFYRRKCFPLEEMKIFAPGDSIKTA